MIGRDDKFIEPIFNHAQTINAIADCLFYWVVLGNAGNAPRYPKNSGVRDYVEANFTEGAELFVLCHEYGHAIAGHLNKNRTVLRAIGNNKTVEQQYILKSWQDEFEADLIGFNMLLEDDEDEKKELEQFFKCQKIGGVFLFFHIDDYISSCINYLKGYDIETKWITDHPSSEERIQKIMSLVPKELNGSILEWLCCMANLSS